MLTTEVIGFSDPNLSTYCKMLSLKKETIHGSIRDRQEILEC